VGDAKGGGCPKKKHGMPINAPAEFSLEAQGRTVCGCAASVWQGDADSTEAQSCSVSCSHI
jgi:hypothetical protein